MDETAITKQEPNQVQKYETITKELIIDYLKTFELSKKMTENEISQFVGICTISKLNPFKREIYCVVYGEGENRKLSIVTGYEVYIKRADSLRNLNGWNVKTVGKFSDGSLKAVLTIHRKDWSQPFEWEVLFSEYNQNRNLWKSKPITMIKKVAVCQGFRLCFPNDYEGVPYAEDELPNEMINITDKAEIKPAEKIPEQNKEPEKKITLKSVIESIEDETQRNCFLTLHKDINKNNDPLKRKELLTELNKSVKEYISTIESEHEKINNSVAEGNKKLDEVLNETSDLDAHADAGFNASDGMTPVRSTYEGII